MVKIADTKTIQEENLMKVFLDEAGNTGCVINNSDIMNFGPQRHFSLCGVIARDGNDEKMLRQRYIDFMEKFQITDELKGSSLLTRDNNDKLEYFINNILIISISHCAIMIRNFIYLVL